MGMGRRQRRQSFADMVRAVERELADEAASSEPAAPAGPGLRRDGTMTDAQGRVHTLARPSVSAGHAHAAAASGALVAWDPCGCGGGCGFRWLDREETAALVRSGPPRIRRGRRRLSNVSEWHAADGSVLLVAEDDVVWGDLLA